MYSSKFIRNNFDFLKKKLKLRGVEEEFLNEVYREVQHFSSLQEHDRILNEKKKHFCDLNSNDKLLLIKEIKAEQSLLKKQILEQEIKVSKLVNNLPNIPDDSLTATVKLMKIWGNVDKSKKFIPHKELCKRLDLLSFEEGVSLSGSGFVVYKNLGASIYRSLIAFTLDCNRKKGYEERYVPELINSNSLYGTAQLPKFEEDLFKTVDGMYLSPTAESQLVNLYRDKIIESSRLPIKLTSNTNCFRREAGSHGVEDSGIIRLHQFCKTEIVVMCEPQHSQEMLEIMTQDACSILERLNIPYRILQLSYDDIGFSSSKTYDIEAWFPSEDRYREISSVSNTLDFQARRAKIRFKKRLLDKSEKAQFLHLLNGSSLAIDRLFAAVIDNYQQEDGSLKIPEALINYLGFEKILNPEH